MRRCCCISLRGRPAPILSVDGNRLMLMMRRCFCVSLRARLLMMGAVFCLSVNGNRLMLMMRRCFCVSLRGRPADAHDAALFLRVPKESTG